MAWPPLHTAEGGCARAPRDDRAAGIEQRTARSAAQCAQLLPCSTAPSPRRRTRMAADRTLDALDMALLTALRGAPAGRVPGAVAAHRRRPRHRAARAAAAGGRRGRHRLRPGHRRRRGRLRRPGVRDPGDRAGRAGRRAAPTSRRSPACSRRTRPRAAATCSAGWRPPRTRTCSRYCSSSAGPRPWSARRASSSCRCWCPWRTLPLLRSAAAPGFGRSPNQP